MRIKHALHLGVSALEQAGHGVWEQLAIALAGATLGGITFLVGLGTPAHIASVFGVIALASLAYEAFSASRYLGAHHGFLTSTREPPMTTLRQIGRTLASLLFARGLRLACVLACTLPGLALAVFAHWRASAPLRALAEHVGAFGLCVGVVATGIFGAFVSRVASIDGLGPWAAVRRSMDVASRSWMLTLLAELLGAGSIAAVAIAQRVPVAWLAAVLLRWMRDALLSYVLWAPPPRRFMRATARAPFVAALVVVFVSTHARPASAQQVKLVSPNETQATTTNAPTTTAAAGVLVTTDNPVVEKPAALSVDVAQQKAFVEANVRLADAEEASMEATKRLVEHRAASIGNISATTASEDEDLLDAATKASALVTQRKADLYKAGDDILAAAYGGPYGTLQRNWIDFKNTPSYLLGMAQSTPSGALDTIKGVGSLVGSAYNWVTGSSTPATPAPDPDTERQGRLLDREQQLQTELSRIQNGAAVNLKEGNWAGENVVGPLVLGEGAVAVGRTGLAVRSTILAQREAAAADLVAKSAARAAALEAMNTEAIAGLPSVQGELVKGVDSLGQGGQYLPYKLADGRDALVFRGEPWELRDARVALDAMAKKQPGLMPEIYGSTRLADGEPALVLERFDAAKVAMNNPKGPFLEPYKGVFTPQAYADWKSIGGFGHALDNDYVFLDSGGRPRLALPRRASQFRELVDSGKIFVERSTLTPP